MSKKIPKMSLFHHFCPNMISINPSFLKESNFKRNEIQLLIEEETVCNPTFELPMNPLKFSDLYQLSFFI